MSLKNYDEVMAQVISDYETSIVKIILLCVDNLEFGVGQNKLIQILKGTQTRFITEYSIQKNKAYSLLKQFSKEDIKYIIELLVEMDYLRKKDVKNGMGYVYIVGMNGYRLLEDDRLLEISFIDAITETDFIEFNDIENEQYEKLRNLRYKIACENDFPPYFICGEMTLRLMVKHLPTTEEELSAIKGIGPSFMENYSSRFLAEIRQLKAVE
jgi:ATP-dependent DNA helicase RecQ